MAGRPVSISTMEPGFSPAVSRAGIMALSVVAAILIAFGVAIWAVDAISGGACTMVSPTCKAARLTAVGLGGAVLGASVLVGLLLPRAIAWLWSVLLALAAVAGLAV